MRRHPREQAVMRRRARERATFWPNAPDRPLGIWRKRHPFAACAPSQHCTCCEIERQEHRRDVKRERVAGRREARDEC